MAVDIKDYLEKIGACPEAKEHLSSVYSSCLREKKEALEKGLSRYKNKENWKETFKQFYEEVSCLVIDAYTSNAILLLFLLDELKDRFIKRGYGLEHFYAIIKDLGYKIKECKLVYNVYGIFPISWYESIYNVEIFSFGRLQFQKAKSWFSSKKLGLNIGDTVVAIHIPRDETKLDIDRCKQSIEQAKEFFRKDIGSDVAFICTSWIILPNLSKRYKPNSNLAKFNELFDVVTSIYNDDYKELWRIYDREITSETLKNLPSNTSLEKAVNELIKDGEKIGEGFGILR